MPLETVAFDPAEMLNTPEARQAYLEMAMAEGDPTVMAEALGVLARAEMGMKEVADRTGLARESLYRAFGKGGNPQLSTFVKVLNALGFDLRLRRREGAESAAARIGEVRPARRGERVAIPLGQSFGKGVPKAADRNVGLVTAPGVTKRGDRVTLLGKPLGAASRTHEKGSEATTRPQAKRSVRRLRSTSPAS